MRGGSTVHTSIHVYPHQPLVVKCAVASRILLLVLIFLWRILVSSYDTSSPLNPDCLSTKHGPDHQGNAWLPRIGSAIEDSVVWDSVYFVRIAQCGYEYEQSYAFFPLLPVSMSLLSRTVLAPLVPLIGFRAVLALAGYAVSNAAFVLAAVYLYRLSVMILGSPEVALQASVLFCFNPASIFYSSIYTESLYSLSSLGGLYHLISGASTVSVIWFALSACARSNGVLNAGYFCFQTLHQVYDAVFLKKRASLAVQVLILGVLRCICTFAPFVAFQAYGYRNLCLEHTLDETRPWCNAKIPLLYNYIQGRYWGVGFLRYFQFKQLPNFLLASPILSLAVCSIFHYVKSQPQIFLSLGFQVPRGKTTPRRSFSSVDNSPVTSNDSSTTITSTEIIQETSGVSHRRRSIVADHQHNPLAENDDAALENRWHLSTYIVPCTLHLAFMAVTAFFVMHVQVATRFLSSSPPLYWFLSSRMLTPAAGKKFGHLVWGYCIAYILLGSLLFSNFYPFT
ncbi:GPI mannosyltransferase 2 [Linum grandiflorum]